MRWGLGERVRVRGRWRNRGGAGEGCETGGEGGGEFLISIVSERII